VVGGAAPLPVAQPDDRGRAWQAVQDFAREHALDGARKNELLRDVATRLGLDFDAFTASGMLQIMSAEEVRRLPTDLIDVELHTHRHRTPRDREAFVRELRDNDARIAALTRGRSGARHFCYPSGDYDGRFVGWLREFGVTSATTCVPGIAARTTDRYLLPRFIDTMSVPVETFAAWTSGIAALVPRRAEYRLDPRRLSTAEQA
jgi:peptidoglycan/xylan/chitin deacetylase (PgdA/CDA1 family)